MPAQLNHLHSGSILRSRATLERMTATAYESGAGPDDAGRDSMVGLMATP